MIEHVWSHVSRLMAGLYFPTHLPDETVAPCLQSNLTDDEISDKEAVLFDFDLEVLCKFLDGKFYNGNRIDARFEKCKDPSGKF